MGSGYGGSLLGLLRRRSIHPVRFLGTLVRARAIYWSTAPLFDAALGVQPIRPGVYRNAERATIGFVSRGTRYSVSGDATPDTVTLIPISSRRDHFIFQQSDGDGIAFYGALRTEAGFRFAIFSPETMRRQALAAARVNHATLGETGCMFNDVAGVTTALLALIAKSPQGSWDRYHETA